MTTARPTALLLLRQSPCRLPQFTFQWHPHSVRAASQSAAATKGKRKDEKATKKRKKGNTSFANHDLKDADQFALCDAMQYIRAFEVGRDPTSSKYDVAVKLRTLKNGPVLRSRLRLPHSVKTEVRVCVICPPESKHARAAVAAGAVLVGEDTVFDAVKDGRIEFDRCICHTDSVQKLNKSGIARILGPKGLMPSIKRGTVVETVENSVRDMLGGSEYRERMGVVRMPIGQLGFTPEEMQRNIRTFMESIKRECSKLDDSTPKTIHEVVLSSTNAPGFSLNGEFQSTNSVPTAALSTL